jgi:multidrug efflux pump subunit AcrA (membrane-fusion protein)
LAKPAGSANTIVLSGRIEGDDSAVSSKATGRLLEAKVREGDVVKAGDVIAVLDDQQLRDREERKRRPPWRSPRRVSKVAAANRGPRGPVAARTRWRPASPRWMPMAASARRKGNWPRPKPTWRSRKPPISWLCSIKTLTPAGPIGRGIRTPGQAGGANRKDLTVTAPFDGTVVTRTAEPGEVVQAGTAIVTLLDLSKVYLRGFVPEGQIGKVKVGQAARVFLDSNPKSRSMPMVQRIDPQATFTPENTYFRDDRVKQVVGVKLD